MGFMSKRTRYWAIIGLLIAALALAGCNRSATKATATPEQTEEGVLEEETQEQTMDTPTPAGQEPGGETAVETTPTAQEMPAGETTEPEAEATEESAEPEAPVGEQTYTVQIGDTLFGIALRYGVTLEELAARNGIVNVNAIDVGQQLVIPSAAAEAPAETPAEGEPVVTGEQVHIVQPGENLFRISLRYNLSFETVAAYNGIPWPYNIHPGQEILIPPAQ